LNIPHDQQAADRGTPFQETLKAIDEMHKQGKFKTFAISNFTSAEVGWLF
jgi:aflatoxin B1 aldehyde reductase